MAIVNITSLATNYFVMDMPDVQWTGLTAGDKYSVQVTITPLNGAVVQFTETYVADTSGAVTLRGLAELLQPYVKPSPTELTSINLSSTSTTLVTVTRATVALQLYDDDTPANTVGPNKLCYVYYSNQRTDTYPGSIKKWLSRYTERTLYRKQRVIASAFYFSGVSAKMVVHYVPEATVVTNQMTPNIRSATAATPPTDAFVLAYTLDDIATSIGQGCTKDNIRIIDVQLLDGSTVKDTIRYRVDRGKIANHRIVAFTNCYGMFETEVFAGTDEQSDSMDGEYSWIDNAYEKIAEEMVLEHKLCAGHITDEQRRSIRDIARSPKVAIVYKGEGSVLAPAEYEPMTVTAIDITDKAPHTEPQTAYVTLRHAPRHHEVVSRGSGSASYDDGIFDYTFDNSYN